MKQINSRWILLVVLLAIICFGISWWLMVRNPVRFGAVAVTASSGSGRLILGYILTLVGVIVGTAYRELQSRKDKGETILPDFNLFLKSIFLSIDFWLGICGSPLVYALIVQATEGGGMAGLAVMAIQNGFFCTVVISGLTPTKGGIIQNSPPKPEQKQVP